MPTKASKLPSGNWRIRVQYYEDGKRHFKSVTAKTKKEAEYRAALYAVANKNERATGQEMTVSQAITAFIRDRSSVLSPSTVRAYQSIARTHLASIQGVRLADITTQQIQAAINVTASTASPKTVRNVFALLTSALHAVAPSMEIRIDIPKKVHKEITIPQEETIARLLDASSGTIMESAILLAAGYGLRRGEIAALTYADINQESCILHINKALAHTPDGEWVEKAPKSYAGTRSLHVSFQLIEVLLRNRIDAVRICPISPDAITQRFAVLCKQIGAHCRFHDLRHYNASVMLALSVPDKYAMERLGQSTPGLIKSVYQHIIRDKRDEISDTMNSAFNSMLEKV